MRRSAVFLVTVLLATPAAADMYQDASNAKLPEAPVNLGLGYAVKAGGSIQAALTAAQTTGGTVTVAPGAYNITGPLMIGGNTHLRCQAGAVINAVSAGWTASSPVWAGSPTLAHVSNVNNGAATITDQNIVIEGCGFTMDGGWAAGPLGGFHAIEIRKARNVRIVGNRFTGMGNGTAMLASDGTFVDGNYMTGGKNACWDHWEAPQNGVVTASNYCESTLNGSFVTGGGTLGEPGIARNMRVAGTYRLTGTAAGVGVWFNAISATGSGVADSVMDGPIVIFDSMASGRICVKVSGIQTINIHVAGPVCRYGAVVIGSDEGGVASNVTVSSPLIDERTESAGSHPILVQGEGGTSNVTIRDARIRKGAATYTYAVGIEAGATGTVVAGVHGIEAGSSGTVVDAGTDSRIEGVYPTSCTGKPPGTLWNDTGTVKVCP